MTQTVESGKAATAPAEPTRKGYAFSGWDKRFDNVTGNLVVTAQYVVNITGPAFVLSNVETFAGATEVEVTVTLKNNPGILGAVFQISYDGSGLKLNAARSDVSAEGVSFTKPTVFKNPSTFVWDAQDMTWTEDGVILTLFFSIPSTAADGDYNIKLTYDPGDVFDGNGDSIDLAVIDAVVKVR
ncbi:MAG: hypothetical protein E7437_06275 [Ruminococcaceae bacterium]|nr:hypothetical protein [Oscillospiraceae bacterium]